MKHADIIALIRDVEERKGPRKVEWARNIAFARNQQWLVATARGWRPAPLRKDRSRLTLNYIQPMVETIVAKMTQNKPRWDVLPWTGEEDDRMRARATQKLLDVLYEKTHMRDRIERLVRLAYLAEGGAMAVYWDDSDGFGEVEKDPMTGEPRLDKQGNPKVTIYGQPVVEVVSPFDLGMDPYAESIDQLGWIYRIRWVHKSWLLRYLHKRMQRKESGVNKDIASRWDLFAAEDQGSKPEDFTYVYELYHRWEEKRYLLTPERILEVDKWLGDPPIFPYIMAPGAGDVQGNTVAGNAAWGHSLASALIPPQVEINNTVSQIADYKNHTIYPRWIMPRGAQLDKRAFSLAPNAFLEYNPAAGPQPREVRVPSLPSYVPASVFDMIEHMTNIAGIHEISQGKNPGSIQSSKGLQFLAELDITKWGPPAVRLSEVISRVGTMMLRLWRKHAPERVTVRLTGESGELDVMEVYKSEVLSEDVRVVPGSTLGRSKAAAEEEAFTLWDRGLLQDPRTVLKAIDYGGLDDLYRDETGDRLRAKRENAHLLKGDAEVKIHPWDDHVIHMDEHKKVLVSAMYERWPQEAQQRFAAHYEEHVQKFQEIQAAQMQAAAQRGTAFSGKATQAGGSGDGNSPPSTGGWMRSPDEIMG